MIYFLLRCIWWGLLLVVVFVNVRLYVTSPLAVAEDQLPADLIFQLNANRIAIDAGQPEQMQHLFPEGYFFCHALHGLAWIETALRDPALTEKALDEARLTLTALNSRNGKAPFPSYLPPDHGMFYSAWKANLQAGIVLLKNGTDDGDLTSLRRQCDTISDALERSETPFLASYDASVWPCDSFPAIHALATYDRVTKEDRYAQTVQSWLADIKSRLDPTTGLVPHMANLSDGQPATVARATSQVILLRFLADLDPKLAKQQYEAFQRHFFTRFVGIPCVLEYPRGVAGKGDIDSGPLIFGRSISGTVLTMAVAQIFGDAAVADAIAQAGETVGLPWTQDDRKHYVGGALPVGDIIVAYAHVARPWHVDRQELAVAPQPVSKFWRCQVHGISLCLLAATLYARRRRGIRKSPIPRASDRASRDRTT
jgi:hypothetical protein